MQPRAPVRRVCARLQPQVTSFLVLSSSRGNVAEHVAELVAACPLVVFPRRLSPQPQQLFDDARALPVTRRAKRTPPISWCIRLSTAPSLATTLRWELAWLGAAAQLALLLHAIRLRNTRSHLWTRCLKDVRRYCGDHMQNLQLF